MWTISVKKWIFMIFKESNSSPKKYNFVINYSPSCRSKPVRPSFIFRTQVEIFFIKSDPFWPCIDSNVTTTFKAQKRSKDIVKIVHLWSYENTFLCTKNKNNEFIQQFIFFHVSLHHPFTRVTQRMCCCLCRVRKLSDFIKNIFNCFLKMKVLWVWNNRVSN